MLKRILFYMIGVAIGSLGVLYFWKQKEVTFDYGMDARTLKTIRVRKRYFSDEAKQVMLANKIDSTQISNILKNGDVDFSKSKARQKPCGEYYVTGEQVALYIKRCDSTSTIESVIIK